MGVVWGFFDMRDCVGVRSRERRESGLDALLDSTKELRSEKYSTVVCCRGGGGDGGAI